MSKRRFGNLGWEIHNIMNEKTVEELQDKLTGIENEIFDRFETYTVQLAFHSETAHLLQKEHSQNPLGNNEDKEDEVRNHERQAEIAEEKADECIDLLTTLFKPSGHFFGVSAQRCRDRGRQQAREKMREAGLFG